MLLSPIEDRAALGIMGWKQIRRDQDISQLFGKDFIWTDGKPAYARFGMRGHNGVDFKTKAGTPIYASCDGKVEVKNDGHAGYGLHIKLRSAHGQREITLGHLSKVNPRVQQNPIVNIGDLLGWTGNTGFSTGAHLHFGLRFLENNPTEPDIFKWKVRDQGNGYLGYVDPANAFIFFKGSYKRTSILPII